MPPIIRRRHSLLALLGLAALLAACALPVPTPTEPAAPATREETAALLQRLGGAPCPDSDFTCVTLTVPLDHFDPSNGATLDVTFAVLPASGERRGMFVTATGGPGSSGLAAADSYTAAFDPSIPEHFDIVFFDQRGVAASGGLQCVSAAAAFYRADLRTATPDQEAAAIAAARTFAHDCLAEMGHADWLPYLGTRQAVEDLETFRQAIGDEQFWLYGESYGTQFAQTYAAAHPDRLAGLILDGTVDLTLSGVAFYEQQAQAFNDTLLATLQACNEDAACAADVGRDAVAVYDELVARLEEGPISFAFPLPSGGRAERRFTLADLETAVADYLYTESSRMILQRAIAAAAHDDLLPLARMLYDALGLDPETEMPVPDPTWSDAVYYAVECSDYDYFAGSPEERAAAYMRAGDPLEARVPRLRSIFYGDLPCAFWPVNAAPRPAPLTAAGIPTLVLGATADPATPVANGVSVYRRLADGYLITTEGGAHIIFGRGDPCPDETVTAFLVDGARPPQREMSCPGVVATAYVPLAPADASAFANPLEALASADNEMYYLPEYFYWDYVTPTTVGCPYGGTFAFAATDAGEQYTLTDCAFSAGFSMTGSGSYHYDDGLLTLDVSVSGLASGHLTYTRDDEGNRHVSGEYAGQVVDLSE